MQDEAIYRCLNPGCARAMPRRVNYCPYCGTAQAAGMPAPGSVPGSADAHADRAAAAPRQAAAAPAGPVNAAGASATAGTGAVGTAGPGPAAAGATASGTPSGAAASSARTAADAAQAAPPSAHAFGRSGRPVDGGAGAAPAAPPERDRGIPWSPAPAARPQPATPQGRQPVRLRWWIVTLVVLWGVWLWAKPSAKKIDARIDAAIALAQACQGKQAQDELIALRSAHATSRQLERLQRALNEASGACTRKRQRARAWDDARGPIEAALAARNPERARTRLAAFTRRWGEDDATRALEDRIEALKREHPLAVPDGNGGAANGAPPPSGNLF